MPDALRVRKSITHDMHDWEEGRGGIADTYYSQVLARVVGAVRAWDLLLTGRTLSAQEALDWGMVSRVVPHDELSSAATETLAQICRTAPSARREIKASIDDYLGHFARIAMEASLVGPEALEGFQAFKQRRSPEWVHPDLRRNGRL
jgi:enoyl-CoA hydratase/carnithine racemase